jgi:hypothetical protein
VSVSSKYLTFIARLHKVAIKKSVVNRRPVRQEGEPRAGPPGRA